MRTEVRYGYPGRWEGATIAVLDHRSSLEVLVLGWLQDETSALGIVHVGDSLPLLPGVVVGSIGVPPAPVEDGSFEPRGRANETVSLTLVARG